MRMIGHNQGPTMEGGTAWRSHCWTKARKDLLPTLPIEIVRVRVNRARELGLAYKTYATVRATTGQDVIGFLYSSNALRMYRSVSEMPVPRRDKLAAQRGCQRLLAAHRPLQPQQVVAQIAAAHGLDFAGALAAPGLADSWSDIAEHMRAALNAHNLSRKGVLVVGETALEKEWSTAGRMAGYLQADTYFA